MPRGAAWAAVDEAARVGARADATVADCEVRASSLLDALVGGRMRPHLRVRCDSGATTVVAHADVKLAAWLPGIPDWSFTLEGRAVKERVR